MAAASVRRIAPGCDILDGSWFWAAPGAGSGQDMLEELSRNWWVLTVRGVFAILFGLVAWIWPQITVLALLLLFGAYALVDGAGLTGSAIRGGRGPARTWLM